ncbi:hypothetical protein N2152v2_009694 [Parachlorella kessleri]
MGPLEQLLESAALQADPAVIRRLQQQPDGLQQVLATVSKAMGGSSSSPGGGSQLGALLSVLLAPDVQGCCAALPAAEAAKAEGNAAFKQGRYSEAAGYYSDALRWVDELSPTNATLAAALYSNRALCMLRLSPTPDHDAALHDSSCAIGCCPGASKGWYRRACARRGLGDVRGALCDAQHALRLEQGQPHAAPALPDGACPKSAPAAPQRRLPLASTSPGVGVAKAAAAAGSSDILRLVGELASQLRLAPPPPAPPLTATTTAAPAGLPNTPSGVAAAVTAAEAFWQPSAPSPEAAGPRRQAAAAWGHAAQQAQQASGGALTVGWSQGSGRFLAAARELPVGEDVLREQPFALALTKAGRQMVSRVGGLLLCGEVLQEGIAAAGSDYCCKEGVLPWLWPPPGRCRGARGAGAPPGSCRTRQGVVLPAVPHAAVLQYRLSGRCGSRSMGPCAWRGGVWEALGRLAAGRGGAGAEAGSEASREAVLALRLARRLAEEPTDPKSQLVAALEDHFADLAPEEAVRLGALALLTHATWQQALALAGDDSWKSCSSAAGEAEARSAQQTPEASGRAARGVSTEDVLRALCQVRVNGIAVVPPARAGAGDRLGVGIYPTASMMNHSCRPNVSLRFEGTTAVVRTLEAIAPGAPLLHCYGPQEGEMTWQQRQLALQKQYCFACTCTACTAGPTASDVELVGLRCCACCAVGGRHDSSAVAAAGGIHGGLAVHSSTPAVLGSGTPANGSTAAGSRAGQGHAVGAVLPQCAVPAGLLSRYDLPAPQPIPTNIPSTSIPVSYSCQQCTRCGRDGTLSSARWRQLYLPRLQQAAELAARAEEELLAAEREPSGNGGAGARAHAEAAVQLLTRGLQERQQLLHPANQLLGQTHDTLARALCAAHHPPAAAVPHLRASLAVLQHHYPPSTTGVAFQQLQLADMLALAAAEGREERGGGAQGAEVEAESSRLLREAGDVLELHFGRDVAKAMLETRL